MNATSVSPADLPAKPARSVRGRPLVDVLTRMVHGVLALAFTGAFLTSEIERWRQVHVVLGYGVLGAVAVRLVWGLIGPRSARLAIWGPRLRLGGTAWRSLRDGQVPPLAQFQTNLQGMATLSLLALGLLVVASGYATLESLAGEWLEDLHEALANAMLAVVLTHLGLVLVASALRRQNQALTMVTGRAHPWARRGGAKARESTHENPAR